MNRRACAATAAVAFSLGAPAPGASAAAPEARFPTIAASHVHFGKALRSEVTLLNAIGERKRLAEAPGYMAATAWSAATGKVYFSHLYGPGVGVTRVDAVPDAGGAPTGVVEGASDLDVSADGSTLVYVGDDRLYVAPVSGGPARALTGVHSIQPRFSPDGTKVLFSRYGGPGHGLDLFVINTDGTGLRQLTVGSPEDEYGTFSPDGTRVLFTRVTYPAGGMHADLWAMGLDHSKLRHVATAASKADWTQGDYLTFLRVTDSPDRGDVAVRQPGAGGAVGVLTSEGTWTGARFDRPAPAT